jgi:laminin alpha 3/5
MIIFHPTACNCYGHSNECIYDEEVDRNQASVDVEGRREGGGVCTNCQHNTIGINCNECIGGYYRPFGKELNATDVCQRKYPIQIMDTLAGAVAVV